MMAYILECFIFVLLGLSRADEFENLVSKYNADQLELYSSGRFSMEPEASMSAEETINYHGYTVEVYEVTTQDGYILTIHRIPYGINGSSSGSEPRKPVLIQHGLFASSAVWISNTKDKNLPYILADSGYDVWLGNIRGTLYGRKHIKLSPKDNKFWAYSFDEMARYDVPAVIDFILNQTQQNQILYIGHSMGTTMMFALLASQPKYNAKIKGFLALAPAVYLTNIKSPVVRVLKPIFQTTELAALFVGSGEFLPNSRFAKLISATVCNSNVKFLCSNFFYVLSGFDLVQLNQTRLPVYLHHSPAASSVQNYVHFNQLVSTDRFQYHDFGPRENRIKYGQVTPPVYNLSAISTPIAIFWSDNDYLVTPKDVAKLTGKLQSLVVNYRIPYPEFSHLDFVLAVDVKALLYDKLISVMKTLWE